MSWVSVLNDVTARISAASQNLQTFDPIRSSTSSTLFGSGEQPCHSNSIYPDPQSSSMSVRVQLDQHNAPYYTNLDFVTGRVIFNLTTDTTISAIKVKLEGESRTRLSGPKFQNDPRNRQKVNLEVHKLLYKVQTVFPAQNIVDNAANLQFTLAAGQYSYPFSLKIPFNNDCISNTTIFSDIKLGSLLGSDITNARHVKQTLPPGLTGFPGMAEIKYFVKATVGRPKFYQENIRAMTDIRFQPIEPPRPPPRSEETYARRQHQFSAPTTSQKSSKAGIFRKASVPQPDEQPLAVKVEARLPSPTIITCHHPLPLRIMVEKTNDSSASIYLSLLQIELIGTTHVRAHDLKRVETGTWVLMSQANMKLALDNPTEKSPRVFQVPSRFWDNIPVPDTVTPSFNTCNISRSYELEVRVGLNHGTADGVRPELIVLPLRLPIDIFSGIPPPDRILNRLNTQQSTMASSSLRPPQSNVSYNNHHPPSATTPAYSAGLPPQGGSYDAPPADDPYDFPPSYEDAMAEEVTPANGPRRGDSPRASTSQASPRFGTDVKSTVNDSGLGRHPSERLFSQNAPTPPSDTPADLRSQTAGTTTTGTATGQVTNLMTELNVDDDPSRPPPLPVRKGTTDSIGGDKKKSGG